MIKSITALIIFLGMAYLTFIIFIIIGGSFITKIIFEKTNKQIQVNGVEATTTIAATIPAIIPPATTTTTTTAFVPATTTTAFVPTTTRAFVPATTTTTAFVPATTTAAIVSIGGNVAGSGTVSGVGEGSVLINQSGVSKFANTNYVCTIDFNEVIGLKDTTEVNIAKMTVVMFWLIFLPLAIGGPLFFLLH
jgi:hypothetical protein